MLRVFTAFSGYDSQCLALKYAGISYDLVGWSEIDKAAIIAHNALFPNDAEKNFGDISKINWSAVHNFDLFTYSSPCQDISFAGKMAGLKKDSGTRSSLLFCCYKGIKTKRPKYLLFENVAAIASHKFINDLKKWCQLLEDLGYKNYYSLLNSLDFNIPQNRNRFFMVSILVNEPFYFPKPQKRHLNLDAFIEHNAPFSYDLNLDKYINYLSKINNPEIVRKNSILSYTRDKKSKGEVLPRGTTSQYVICEGCKVPLIPTLNKSYSGACLANFFIQKTAYRAAAVFDSKNLKIRKLTPRECYRLMGVKDTDIDCLYKTKLSKTAHYALAGNSIVVDVLMAIFTKMFVKKGAEKEEQLEIMFN